MTKTLLEIRHAVFAYYLQENILCPKTNAKDVPFECSNPDLKVELVTACLQELEKIDMVKSVKLPDGSVWFVLTKPLMMYDQTVTLSSGTCLDIATIVNKYCESANNTRELVDASSIKERDILKLLMLLDSLSSNNESS